MLFQARVAENTDKRSLFDSIPERPQIYTPAPAPALRRRLSEGDFYSPSVWNTPTGFDIKNPLESLQVVEAKKKRHSLAALMSGRTLRHRYPSWMTHTEDPFASEGSIGASVSSQTAASAPDRQKYLNLNRALVKGNEGAPVEEKHGSSRQGTRIQRFLKFNESAPSPASTPPSLPIISVDSQMTLDTLAYHEEHHLTRQPESSLSHPRSHIADDAEPHRLSRISEVSSVKPLLTPSPSYNAGIGDKGEEKQKQRVGTAKQTQKRESFRLGLATSGIKSENVLIREALEASLAPQQPKTVVAHANLESSSSAQRSKEAGKSTKSRGLKKLLSMLKLAKLLGLFSSSNKAKGSRSSKELHVSNKNQSDNLAFQNQDSPIVEGESNKRQSGARQDDRLDSKSLAIPASSKTANTTLPLSSAASLSHNHAPARQPTASPRSSSSSPTSTNQTHASSDSNSTFKSNLKTPISPTSTLPVDGPVKIRALSLRKNKRVKGARAITLPPPRPPRSVLRREKRHEIGMDGEASGGEVSVSPSPASSGSDSDLGVRLGEDVSGEEGEGVDDLKSGSESFKSKPLSYHASLMDLRVYGCGGLRRLKGKGKAGRGDWDTKSESEGGWKEGETDREDDLQLVFGSSAFNGVSSQDILTVDSPGSGSGSGSGSDISELELGTVGDHYINSSESDYGQELLERGREIEVEGLGFGSDEIAALMHSLSLSLGLETLDPESESGFSKEAENKRKRAREETEGYQYATSTRSHSIHIHEAKPIYSSHASPVYEYGDGPFAGGKGLLTMSGPDIDKGTTKRKTRNRSLSVGMGTRTRPLNLGLNASGSGRAARMRSRSDAAERGSKRPRFGFEGI